MVIQRSAHYQERTDIKGEQPIIAVIGILNIVGDNYLGVITEAEDVGMLYGAKVLKVTSVDIIPFS